tara:strand:+ start:1019 stop:2443 length:1425 start_codon:yes stop_codon:yes gene_type:complete
MSSKVHVNLYWYGFSFLIKTFLPLVSLPLFSQFLNIQDFGLFALAVFFGTFISGISNLGLLAAFERNFFEISNDQQLSFLFTLVFFVSLILVGFFSIILVFNDQIGSLIFRNNQVNDLLIYGLVYCGIRSLNQYFYVYLKNKEEARKYSIVSILESTINIIMAVFFVIIIQNGVKGFFIGQTIGSLVVLLFFAINFFNLNDMSFKKPLLCDSLKLSLPLTPKIFFGVINSQFDRYMLGLLGTVGGVGIFDIGQKISNSIFIFTTALQQVFSPQVYRRMFSKDQSRFESVGKYLTPFLYLCILFAMPIALFSREILSSFFPKEFQDASFIISLLSILYVVYFFGKQPQLMYAKKTGIISVLTITSIFLNIALNIPCIYYYGYYGAAFATLISGSISTFLYFYFGQKFTPIYYEKRIIFIFSYYVLCVTFILIAENIFESFILVITIKLLMIICLIIMGIRFKIFDIRKSKSFFKQ